MHSLKNIDVVIEESSGIDRFQEPVTVGIPFSIGLISEESKLVLRDDQNNAVPIQKQVLSRWPDKSIKWMLADFLADCPANSSVIFTLILSEKKEQFSLNERVKIKNSKSSLLVETGKTIFVVDKANYLPFISVECDGEEITDSQLNRVILIDDSHENCRPVINSVDIETDGFMRSTINISGQFKSKEDKVFSEFFSRISYYANKSFVKVDFTLKNPKAATHPGGLWDLGDSGSVYFEELFFEIALSERSDISTFYKTQVGKERIELGSNGIEIYQDSSGGENWDSPVHVNSDGKVMNSFRGYKASSGEVIEEGLRATPEVITSSGDKMISASLFKFWQNFPKAIEADKGTLTVRIFPKQYQDSYELQGGEQKTHTMYLQFTGDGSRPADLDWIQSPLSARVTPLCYAESMALGYISPEKMDVNESYKKLVDAAIKGDSNLFDLREEVDEYGWRNFGDIYANHEIVAYKGQSSKFISHYNNQYDMIYGCILQYARSGDARWSELMEDLSRHVIDIDIYHTTRDRPAFSGGMFWHTDHFMHAETSSHRSYSRKTAELNKIVNYGGGPSPEHCYTSGLCALYYMTGNVMAKEAVIEMADWIMNVDNLEKSFYGLLRKGRRFMNSFKDKFPNAMGRAEANSINALLDACELSGERKYLRKAEKIIKKFISPSDDIDRLNQQQMELRWFYLMFLQSLGKYLDFKSSFGELDNEFHYGRESYMYHVNWMLKNELPYKQLFHIVEIPSSTWCAQDIRKSVIFDYAYKFSDDASLKSQYKAKAEDFFNSSLEDVMSFEDGSRTFVRILAILMNYGAMHSYFQNSIIGHDEF